MIWISLHPTLFGHEGIQVNVPFVAICRIRQPFGVRRLPRSFGDPEQNFWNLENAAGWGGASPEAFVGNQYANSPKMKADTCYTSTFDDPENEFFTSITAYDNDKYLMEGVRNINSHSWVKNSDGTITVSFNCGELTKNNIDTQGNDFTFTTRHYGVNPKVMNSAKDPIISAVKAQ